MNAISVDAPAVAIHKIKIGSENMSDEAKKCIVGDGNYVNILLAILARQKEKQTVKNYILVEPEPERSRKFRTLFGVSTVPTVTDAIAQSGALIIAMESSENARKLMDEIRGKLLPDALVVCMTNSIKISELEDCFPGHPVMRLCLNPSAISGTGVGAFLPGSIASKDVEAFAKTIFMSLGREIPVSSEEELELVWNIIYLQTIYSYIALQTIIGCSVKAGLSEPKAKYIAGQIIAGTLKTVLGTKEELGEVFSEVDFTKAINHGLKIGRLYGFQEALEKAMSIK